MAQSQAITQRQDLPSSPVTGLDDDHCLAWIDTLVCDFVFWYLNHFEGERVKTPRLMAREFGKAWKTRFLFATDVDAGLEHATRLVGMTLPVEALQSINAKVAQELKLFFLARPQETMTMRLSQVKFVDLQGAIIDRNLSYCAQL